MYNAVPDPVRGELRGVFCQVARDDPHSCGPEGLWWFELLGTDVARVLADKPHPKI